ncbi:glycosyltransferase family 8 protein [Streptococcus suis]|uniref:glycosyltransferase family 8 protein n=1 Tax=Streptococcus suis TaxID=1307 RepID=UPI00041CCADE|nr:glycosyltransferase family 8 protein [Streptococcus suis]
MISKKTIDIVIASDKNYLPHAETLLISIGKTNTSYQVINVHLFGNNLTQAELQSLKQLLLTYSAFQINYFSINNEKIQKLIGGGLVGDRSLSTYARIFIPDLLESDRALYLDVDAVVNSDLAELYEIDLTGYAIAGVRDTNPVERRKNVGLKPDDIYINAGMILWNLDYCRKIHFVEQCREFIHQHNGEVDAMDQGTINGVLGKQNLIKAISPKYNAFSSIFQLTREQIEKLYHVMPYYDDSTLAEARNNPTFIHYTPNMMTRPWVEHCGHPLATRYLEYRNLTNYPLRNLDKDTRGFKQQLLSFLYNHFPTLFIKLFSK